MKKRKTKTVDDILKWAEDKSLSLGDILTHIYNSIPLDYGTPVTRKILACKMLPPSFQDNISKLCDAAGVSRKAWYRAHADEEFGKHCVELTHRLKGPSTPGIMMAFIQNALDGDTKAQLAHLQDVGVYEGDKPGETNVNVQVVIQQLHEKRKENQRLGMKSFGFDVPEHLHTDS